MPAPIQFQAFFDPMGGADSQISPRFIQEADFDFEAQNI